jgi:hypothetical protein
MGWWVGFECVELGEQIAMPVEEGAIHSRAASDRRDADLFPSGVDVVEGL